MNVDDALISKLEGLSKLRLTNEEKAILKEDLAKMIEMFGQISDIDTAGVKPLIHMTDVVNNWREDEAINQTPEMLERLTALWPKKKNNFIAVPKVIDK